MTRQQAGGAADQGGGRLGPCVLRLLFHLNGEPCIGFLTRYNYQSMVEAASKSNRLFRRMAMDEMDMVV
jgi:hypothetical protein